MDSAIGTSLSEPSDTDYSLWNYSADRSNIVLRVQTGRKKKAAQSAEECFGQALREFRKARGLTQEELAFQSGYHPTYIGLLERGKKSPSLRTIFGMAKALEVGAAELVAKVESSMGA